MIFVFQDFPLSALPLHLTLPGLSTTSDKVPGYLGREVPALKLKTEADEVTLY